MNPPAPSSILSPSSLSRRLGVLAFQSKFPLLAAASLLCVLCGCATIRVTDPPRTATEQLLESQACAQAIARLSAEALRDRRVYVDSTYLTGFPAPTTRPAGDSPLAWGDIKPSAEDLFLLGELRSRLLGGGVRLAERATSPTSSSKSARAASASTAPTPSSASPPSTSPPAAAA